MQYKNGEITIAPKVIFWVGIPSVIKKNEQIELLKNDVLIVEHNGNSQALYNLKKTCNKYTAYFYNLENLLLTNKINHDDIYTFMSNIATFIESLAPERSLVHTNVIDENIANIFRYRGISYVEKNLKDKKIAFSTLINIIRPFFAEKDRLKRSVLRLILLPMKYKVEIINLGNKIAPLVEGYIKDLSLNGMCIALRIKSHSSFFELKDRIQMKLFLKYSIIKIDMAFITRIDKKTGEMGINFNITDEHMIREDNASKLTTLIYDWIKEIIQIYGNIEMDNAQINSI